MKRNKRYKIQFHSTNTFKTSIKNVGKGQSCSPPSPPYDTRSKLIKEIIWNYLNRKAYAHLIKELRDHLYKYDPTSEEIPYIRVVVVNGKKGTREIRVSPYISCFSVYLDGVEIKEFVWELGKYPERHEEKKEEPKENVSKKQQKAIKRCERFSSKSKGKEKKKDVLVEKVRERQLGGSHFVGFTEGYGDGLVRPSAMQYGWTKLKDAIEEIFAGFHVPEPGITSEICRRWCRPMTLIAVMLCESGRFYPLSDYFGTLMGNETAELLPGMEMAINNWSFMSKVFRGDIPSKKYEDGEIPETFENLTEEIVKKLCQDKRWVVLVLAVLCRVKDAGEGERFSDPREFEAWQSSSGPSRYEKGETSGTNS